MSKASVRQRFGLQTLKKHPEYFSFLVLGASDLRPLGFIFLSW